MKKITFFTNYTGTSKYKLFIIPVIISTLFVFCKPGHSDDKSDKTTEVDGLKVPAGFSIERVAGPGMVTYPMFASFDGQGRLFVFESDGSSPSTEDMLKKPPYHIRLLEDTNGDGIFDKSKIFADSLSFPKGGVFYKGSLYVTASPDLLRLTDTDGDGVADKRDVILTGWVLNHNGALLGGPFFGPDGWMYLTDARRGFDITTKEGKNLKGTSARIWRCRPDGTGLESMSGGGYDNAIELSFMPSGETIGTMTYFIEPQGGMRDALMHWVEGGVYPKPYPVIEQDHFKLTGDLMPVMTKTARVAPSGLMRYRGAGFGKEYTGNLFSAEFNTGRIMRHQITPDGATYKTVDEPFITSTVSDIHLTDVLEDADGSMLVLNTGGWFIAGCPLSRVAKLDVHGGIYRIKKKGSEHVEDPWGHKIQFKSLTPENLVAYMKDPRHAVRDNAIEQLIEIGERSVVPIKNSILASNDEEIRAAGVFALSRINTLNAWQEVRAALNDSSAIVRTAAARVLGLGKNKEAVNKLMEIVQKDKPSVRRQAATALGQIGDSRAVTALLNGATDSIDRFVDHAITYALINLKTPAPLIAALHHSSPNVRKVAVIALDQMDGTPLQKEAVVPFLASENTQLRNTGIWVASHHTDWADIVVNFLRNRLNNANLSTTDATPVRDLMITFAENKQLQNFVGGQLGNDATPVARKALMIDVINHSSVKEIPGVWVQQLSKLLQSGDPELRSLVLALIESRNIKALNEQLKLIVQNPNTPADFRLKALGSMLSSDPRLSETEFRMVLNYLDAKNESPVRQLAARVLGSAKLSNMQLLTLAKEEVSQTDVFLLPNLVNAFQGNSDPQVGKALIAALSSKANRLDNLSEQDLEKLFGEYPKDVKASAEPLMAKLRERNAGRLAQLQQVEANLKRGDVAQGRKLFFGKAICSTCHSVGNQGGDFAPDLTNIGEIRSRHDILEAILFPSASFAREHETSKVITKTSTYTGIIRQQLPEALIVSIAPGQNVRVQRSEITAIEPQSVSMMPPGLDKQLSNEELSDLIAYLTSLPDGMGGHGNEH
ncbi:PVC-type heme-binding CxxCH protein [Segetibacter koreensis]|uniref:PVC-type heme-binding CxxCH protein n=1 Tax=Segetibacter koreensis TaxID=398037 RepID=UPI000363D7FB|nr:PVC-type heme-binding CxxCH protein [Segetibacter koreensis]